MSFLFRFDTQVLANLLSSPLASAESSQSKGWPYVAFDLDPKRVKTARSLGFPVIFGDGSRPQILTSAGVTKPKAIMVCYTGRQRAVQAVQSLSEIYKGVPIYARAQDLSHLMELKSAGATEVVPENTETSLRLGSRLLEDLGMRQDDVTFVRRTLRESMEFRARELGAKGGESAESQVLMIAPPKLERGPRTNPSAPAAEAVAGAAAATAVLQTAGQPVTAAGNRVLEKGLGAITEDGQIPLPGGVALASWRDSQEGVLLQQEIALRKQLEDLKMEQVKLKYGLGTEQGPYCLVPAKEAAGKDDVSTEAAPKAAAEAIAPALATVAIAGVSTLAEQSAGSGNGASGVLAAPQGGVENGASAVNDVSSVARSPVDGTATGEDGASGSNGASVSASLAEQDREPSPVEGTGDLADGARTLRVEETNEAEPSVSGRADREAASESSTPDDSLWAWASATVGETSRSSGVGFKMQERGPERDDDLGSAQEEDVVWSWVGKREEGVEKQTSIDDDIGSPVPDEDSVWSWATPNRAVKESEIDAQGFLRAAANWEIPSRGSVQDVVQMIPLKQLALWVGKKRAGEELGVWAENSEGSGGSPDLDPVGEVEDYDEFSDGDEFSGYMTVEEVRPRTSEGAGRTLNRRSPEKA